MSVKLTCRDAVAVLLLLLLLLLLSLLLLFRSTRRIPRAHPDAVIMICVMGPTQTHHL